MVHGVRLSSTVQRANTTGDQPKRAGLTNSAQRPLRWWLKNALSSQPLRDLFREARQNGKWIAHGHAPRFCHVTVLITLGVYQPLLNKKGRSMNNLQPQS